MPGDLDVEPFRKQRFEPGNECVGMISLPLSQQTGQRALTLTGQRNQSLCVPFKLAQLHMRFKFEWPVKMSFGDQVAQIVIARLILRKEWQIIDLTPFLVTRDTQQSANDWLNAFINACARKGDRPIQTVAVTDGDSGKAAFLRKLGNRLGLDGPFKHRV